jgi:integrase
VIDRQGEGPTRRDQSVPFSKEELNLFLKSKSNGLSKGSTQVIRQITGYIWEQLNGRIDPLSLQNLAEFFISRYPSHSAVHKCFVYTRLFLMYLYKSRMDARLLSYHSLFEKPKNRKTVKLLTSRVITIEDIRSIVTAIEGDRDLPEPKRMNYLTQVLFLAYSGQRPITVSRLTVGQFREALSQPHPVLKVEASQDKIRMEHLVPLHPEIMPYVQQQIANRSDQEVMFNYVSLQRWLKALSWLS